MFYPLGYEPLLNSHYEVVEKWIVVRNCIKKTQESRLRNRKRKEKTHSPSAFCILPPDILSSETLKSQRGLQKLSKKKKTVLLICNDCFLLNVHLLFC